MAQIPMPSSRPTHRGARATAALVAAGGVVFALGAASVHLRPVGSPTALWWPAAAVGVVMLLRSPAQLRPVAAALIVVATALGNLQSGRPIGLSLAFALANAAEAATTTWLLTRRGPPRLRTTADVGHLVSAVAGGALVIGLAGGVAVAVLVDGDLLATTVRLVCSHASAVLLLLPLALVDRDAEPAEAGRWEAAAQWALLVAAIGFVFSPEQDLPLSLLPVIALVWTAARSHARVLVRQLAVLAVAVTALTAMGWGPFAPHVQGAVAVEQTTGLVQTFLLLTGVIALLLAGTVAERRDALARLTHLAAHDRLTGVLNRHGLEEHLGRTIAGGAPFALVLVDLDGFKEVNDRYGHLTGDDVLVEIAARLLDLVGDAGVVARMGGDEFVLVLPGPDVGGPGRWEQAVATALARPIAVAGTTVSVGTSIGTARGDGRSTPALLLRDADVEMYAAKRGRERRRERERDRDGERDLDEPVPADRSA
jgi:diguanylate cyclase (GGDEF)-like protein